ncbi:hypothetical protein PENTCL1PPCAC_1997, partial [Pristionchus entomophagus]
YDDEKDDDIDYLETVEKEQDPAVSHIDIKTEDGDLVTVSVRENGPAPVEEGIEEERDMTVPSPTPT